MDEKTTKKGVLAFLKTEQEEQRCLLWTSATAISLIVLPRILKALWMTAQQTELAAWQIGGCTLISYITAALCVLFAMRSVTKGTLGETATAVLQLSIWLWLLETVKEFLNQRTFLANHEFVERVVGRTYLAYAPRAACLLLLDILQAICIVWFLLQASGAAKRMGTKGRARTVCANWLAVLLFACSYFLVKLVYIRLLTEYVQGFGKSRTVVAYLTKVMLLAVLVGLAMAPSFLFLLRKIMHLTSSNEAGAASQAPPKKEVVEDSTQPSKGAANPNGSGTVSGKPWNRKLVMSLVIVLIPLALIITLKIVDNSLKRNNSDYVLNDIALFFEDAEYRDTYEDYIGILRDIDYIDAVVQGWKAYIEGDEETLEQLRRDYSELEQVEVLLDYMQAEDEKNLEDIQRRLLDKLYDTPNSAPLHWAYLELIPKDMDEDSSSEYSDDEIRSYIVTKLVAADYYRNETVTPFSLSEKDLDRIAEGLKGDVVKIAKESFITAQMRAELLESRGKYGSDYDKCVMKMIEYAAANPDNLSAQGAAVSMAVNAYAEYRQNVKTTSKTIGEELLAPAKQYDALVEKLLASTDEYTVEEKNEILEFTKMDVAAVMYECRQLEELQSFLEDAVKKVDSEQLSDFLMLAAIYNRDYATARPLLDANLAKYPDEMCFVSLQAILSYREDNYTQSLEAAVKLAELAVRDDAEPEAGAELLAIVDTYVYGDHSLQAYVSEEMTRRRGLTIYPNKLTEEQKQIIQKSEILSTLLECEETYDRGGTILFTEQWRYQYGDAEKKLEALIAKYPKLSATYYILGKFYGNYSDGERYDKDGEYLNMERAEAMYLKCLELDPNQPVVWFTLGGFYDHEKKYQECYDCNNKVIELATFGHYGIFMGDDNYGYGIVPHAKVTLDRVKEYLDREEERK